MPARQEFPNVDTTFQKGCGAQGTLNSMENKAAASIAPNYISPSPDCHCQYLRSLVISTESKILGTQR